MVAKRQDYREVKLGALAACVGFILMVFELVAARVLAPTIGSSTYVWTSVIGVIILALSAGYWWGGKIADLRARQSDIGLLFLAVACAIAVTAIIQTGFLQAVSEWQVDVRLAAVIASLVLFAPASFLIGAISPYLAKLNVVSLSTSGSAVAHLGALNSLGGILGTFLTGFLLFEVMGARAILTMLIVLCAGLAWWSGLVWRTRNVALLLVAFLLALLASSGGMTTTIDTASAHYTIKTVQVDNQELRLLASGPGGTQSGVFVGAPEELAFWYTREIARVVSLGQQPKNILILGGGAYTLPAYFANHYPKAQIDVVEIDPQLAGIAEQYFAYRRPANVTHIAADARTYVNHAASSYDVVIVDAFGDDSMPLGLVTAEYGAVLKRIVAPGGTVLANILVGEQGVCGELLHAVTRPYMDQFAHGYFVRAAKHSHRSNTIAVFSDSEQQIEGYRMLRPGVGQRFTDDFNAVTSLEFACKQQAKSG